MVEIRNLIVFDFYLGLPHDMCVYCVHMFCVKQSICVRILSTAILVSWLCRGGRESVLFGDPSSKETTKEAQGKGEDEEERAGQGMHVV